MSERIFHTNGSTSVKLPTVDLLKKGSIDSLIRSLEQYKSELPDMVHLFVRRLADVGLTVAKKSLSNAIGDASRDYILEIEDVSGTKASMRIRFSGEGVLFWEFGAGIRFNEDNENPLASQFGMGVGTYPNQTHAYDPNGWFYRDSSGRLHHSWGTEAAMPMYKAWMEMMEKVNSIAERSFF